MDRGQIFTLDLFVSLIVVVAVISMSTVIIDKSLNQALNIAEHTKLQNLAMDLAAYEYYNGVLPNGLIKGPFVFGNTSIPSNKVDCAVSIRGTSQNEVKVYVCQ